MRPLERCWSVLWRMFPAACAVCGRMYDTGSAAAHAARVVDHLFTAAVRHVVPTWCRRWV